MSGFNLSTTIQLSIIRSSSYKVKKVSKGAKIRNRYRLSKSGQIE